MKRIKQNHINICDFIFFYYLLFFPHVRFRYKKFQYDIIYITQLYFIREKKGSYIKKYKKESHVELFIDKKHFI